MAWPLILEAKQGSDLIFQFKEYLFNEAIFIDMSVTDWTDSNLIDKLYKANDQESVLVSFSIQFFYNAYIKSKFKKFVIPGRLLYKYKAAWFL